MADVPAPRTPADVAGLGLADVVALRDQIAPAVEAALVRGVQLLRSSGASWADVARVLGCSRQAAHERFRHADAQGWTLCVDRSGPTPRAYMRDNVTGVEFRDPVELVALGQQTIQGAITSSTSTQP